MYVGTGGYPMASDFGQAHGGVAHAELKILALTVRPR